MPTTKPSNWDDMVLAARIEWLLTQMDQKDARIASLEASVSKLALKVGITL